MSATITQNWLEQFKRDLGCGYFPSKTSNPEMEGLTGLVGVLIERVLCECPDALDVTVTQPNIEDNSNSLLMWYNKIKCGEFFESQAQAYYVFAMALNKWLECCEDEAADLISFRAVTDNATLLATDAYDVITVNAATAKAITVPPNADVDIPIGATVEIIRLGAGAVAVVAGVGVTVNSPNGLNINNQYGRAFLRKTATDTWNLLIPENTGVNLQTGTSYTPTLDDEVIDLTNAAAIVFTVPLNADVAFPVGKLLEVHRGGAGAVTIVEDVGVTLHSIAEDRDIEAQYGTVYLRKIGTNSWRMWGDLVASA